MDIEIKYTLKVKGLNLEINEEEARALFNKLKSHFEPPQYFFGTGTNITIPYKPSHPWTVTCSANGDYK
jgi:hypothetical protein